jgi:hypothetical protein
MNRLFGVLLSILLVNCASAEAHNKSHLLLENGFAVQSKASVEVMRSFRRDLRFRMLRMTTLHERIMKGLYPDDSQSGPFVGCTVIDPDGQAETFLCAVIENINCTMLMVMSSVNLSRYRFVLVDFKDLLLTRVYEAGWTATFKNRFEGDTGLRWTKSLDPHSRPMPDGASSLLKEEEFLSFKGEVGFIIRNPAEAALFVSRFDELNQLCIEAGDINSDDPTSGENP